MSDQKMRLPMREIYCDDEIRSPLETGHTPADHRLLAEIKLLGEAESREMARPIQLLGNFKPMRMLARLKEHAQECNGRATLAVIDRKNASTVLIWDSEADVSLSTLVNLRMSGCWILGYLTFPASGGAFAYPEPCDETELYGLLLNTFARGYADNPQWLAAEQLLSLADNSADLETTLNGFSDWQDKFGLKDIHSEITVPASICTESGQTGKADHAR